MTPSTFQSEYDPLAIIYSFWSDSDPAAKPSLDFYLNCCRASGGPVVELGVGSGRIAVEVACAGIRVIGVDISSAMLEKCREKAKLFGVEKLIDLRFGKIQNFSNPEKVPLVILPFRTLGHLLSKPDRLSTFQNVYKILLPGGRFVFDHYIFNKEWAKNHDGIPLPMGEYLDNDTGIKTQVWDIYHYDYNTQMIKCEIVIEQITLMGTVLSRETNLLIFSWIIPEEVKELAIKSGFQVEHFYGSFNHDFFDSTSKDQVWILQKPYSDFNKEWC